MEEIELQMQMKHLCQNVIKIYFSKKLDIYFVITSQKKEATEFDLTLYKSKSFHLISKSTYNNKDSHPYDLYELENGYFMLLFGSKYSKIELMEYNKELNKLEKIQIIIDKEEYWHENYLENVKKAIKSGYAGVECFHSYINKNTNLIELCNSNLIILFLNAYGGHIWYNGDWESDPWNILLFYKFNEKEKKYEKIKLSNEIRPVFISKFKNIDFLISVDDDKSEFRIGRDYKYKYFIKKIDLKDEKNIFGYNNIETTIKLENLENIYNDDLIFGNNNEQRIFLGKNKKGKYHFYHFDIFKYIITEKN